MTTTDVHTSIFAVDITASTEIDAPPELVREVLADGRHRFLVEPAGDGRTRFVQSERLSGALVPAFRTMLTRSTPAAFVAMNDALATRVQGRVHDA